MPAHVQVPINMSQISFGADVSYAVVCMASDAPLLSTFFKSSVQRKHCSIEVKRGEAGKKGTVTLIGGRGDVLHNGKRIRKQDQVTVSFPSVTHKLT